MQTVKNIGLLQIKNIFLKNSICKWTNRCKS